MPIKKRFNKTIEALSAGHRYLTPLESEEIAQIKLNLAPKALLLNESLCLLQNTSSYLPEITPQIIELLQSCKDHDTVIHLLNVSRRHIISAFQRDGQRLPADFLVTLKSKLYVKNWEVVEWATRTIDECGSQALFFKEDLIKIRPSKIGMAFNEHKRHIRVIIDLMLKKWRLIP